MKSAVAAGGQPIRPVVVFHADDFGMNRAVNDGVLRGFEQGALTSASILANAPAAVEGCKPGRTAGRGASRIQSPTKTGKSVVIATRRSIWACIST